MQTQLLTPLVTNIGHSLGFSGSADTWFRPGWSTSTSGGYGGYSGHNMDTYASMLRQPWIAAAAKVRILLMLSYLQEYSHEDPAIELAIRTQIRDVPGSFKTHQSQMASSIYCGFSVTDKWHTVKARRASLAGLNWIDPRYIKFKLRDDLTLETRFKKGDLDIELTDFVHIKNEPMFNLGNNPAGVATLDRAVPFWEQYRLVMLAMAIAAQRQATPLLLGKTNAGTDEAAKKMLEKLQEARNSGVMVIDILDMVEAIAQQTDGAFFVSVLRILRQGILMSFLIPETILGQGESGSGDSNLNSGHTEILRMTSRTEAGIFGEELVDQLFRPIIEFNYGNIGNWGSFPLRIDEPRDPNGLITALQKTVEASILDAETTAKRIAELAGI
jgi:hypothetical protein